MAVFAVAVLALGWGLYQYEGEPEYLDAGRPEFVALFASPPSADSPQTRSELDALLEIQRHRSAKDVETARANRKTEVSQFAGALGLDPETMRGLPALDALAEQVEDDVRPYVRAAKHHFTRLRPYELDSRLEPCIDNVRDDLSYPSGHATYGYVVAYLLSDLVPERRDAAACPRRGNSRSSARCAGCTFRATWKRDASALNGWCNDFSPAMPIERPRRRRAMNCARR